jgi:hypothetical protein
MLGVRLWIRRADNRGFWATTGRENGFVRIREHAPWLAEYLHELTVFPNGKHDEQADSTGQFLDWYENPAPTKATSSGCGWRPRNSREKARALGIR